MPPTTTAAPATTPSALRPLERTDGTPIDLNTVIAAYVRALLWSSTYYPEGDDGEGAPFDEADGEVDAGAMAKTRAVVARFLQRAIVAIGPDAFDEGDDEQIGHDFALTRNRHGAGFWDGDWPIHGDALTDVAQSFGEVYPWAEPFYPDDEDGAPYLRIFLDGN